MGTQYVKAIELFFCRLTGFSLVTLLIVFQQQLFAQSIDSIGVEKEIDSLITLNKQYTAKIKYKEAIDAIELAEKQARKLLGEMHLKYALALFYHGRTQYLFGHLKEAETLYLGALHIQKKDSVSSLADYGWTLNNLGGLYWKMGNYKQAENFYTEAIQVRKLALGEGHPDYAWSLHNLGILYVDMGYYEKAEQLYKKAKDIRELNPGHQSKDYAYSLNHMALLYRLLGNYKLAEEGHLEALEIFKQLRGNENPDVAWVLGNLYSLYDILGNDTKAEECAKEVVRIREKLFGRNHADFALALINLAEIQMRRGNFREAEASYLEAKNIHEKIYGKQHIEHVRSLENLASLYQSEGEDAKAESYWKEAYSLCKQFTEINPSEYIYTLTDLAEYYLSKKEVVKAESFLNEAEMKTKTLFGSQHPRYARCLDDLTEIRILQKNYPEASSLAAKASEIYKSQLSNSRFHLSEYELGLYLKHFEYKLDRDYYLAVLYPECADVAMDNTLFFKSFLLQNTQTMYRVYQKDSVGRSLLDELKSYHRRLGKELEKPLREQVDIAEIEEKISKTEKELAKRTYQKGISQEFVTRDELSRFLGEQDAAIEFVHFNINPYNEEDSIVYGALITKHNQGHTEFIPLCSEKELNDIFQFQGERRLDYVNSIYTFADRGARQLKSSAKDLKTLLFDPISNSLTGIKKLYFSSSGLMHRINLNAIPLNESETLADHFNLIGLNSTRQLILSGETKPYDQTAVLFGGIQFDRDSSELSNEQTFASRSATALNLQLADATMRGENWSYLPGTDREVKAIDGIMRTSGIKTELLSAHEATEEAFELIGKEKPAPRILHIATHGYFFPDRSNFDKSGEVHDSATKEDAHGQVGSKTASRKESTQEPVFKWSDHPMLRSGLILAGGNSSWQGTAPRDGREDGILTAYEISQMDLSNTELVVLSACETGLGEIHRNEGVFGLQRAFKIAGVKYMIMSLWQVPDKQTSLLMTTFYKKYLENKMSIPDAFHAAQKELRDLGLDPYQWAGFILIE